MKTEKQKSKQTKRRFPSRRFMMRGCNIIHLHDLQIHLKKFCFYTSWFEVARNFQDSLEQKKILSKSTFKYKVHFLLLTSFSVTLINEQLIENVNSVILREK
jgi:hypothetical protein